VFLDESGMLMAPLVRRSWAPCGQTPILYQRTRSRQKVSAIAALCVSPERDDVRLFFRLHVNANINTAAVIDFLRHLSRELDGPIIMVWDRLQTHKSKAMRLFLAEKKSIHSCMLPPYAPELNSVEYLWSYFKTNPLANLAPSDADSLAANTRHHGRSLQNRPSLLRSFIIHSPLLLRLN
jgi:transposase